MERQRSISLKPTRFLVFSFTICSSIIFFSTFTVWVIKSTPSAHPRVHLQVNQSSLNVGLRPLTVQTLTGFRINFTATSVKKPDFVEDHLIRSHNVSGFESFSALKSEAPEESEDTRHKSDASGGNFTTLQLQESVVHESASGKVSDGKKKTMAGIVGKTEIPENQSEEAKKTTTTSPEQIEEKTVKNCDLTNGRWVFDESYPLYTKDSCPFIDEGFDCEGNGRSDRKFAKWRWQPQGCDLPRFNATRMLEIIRGKRLVFVGDSINRNQWESMLCMLTGAVRDPKRVYETHGRKITKEKGNYSFRFLDYQCTVEYYVSHFLVHESKARIGQKRRPTLRIDTIDHGSSRWRGADILIFNTAHWWSHYKIKAGINYFQEGSQVHPQLDVFTAFRKALTTWASWVDKRINPRRTRIFFRSSAPSHFRGGQWNSGGHCTEATLPLNETLNTGFPEKNMIVEDAIKQMKTPVTFLNITRLSEYRIDGHPSIYGRRTRKGTKPSGVQDCSHWCLPGVPDAWNELLYFHLQSR
ncbi:hypothetical protein L6164_034780 [Bauhinia variegata]|uniref:Uncharacterized protein n=1 Tax=Bauhinia variegata TaxID=167791 RepID=A0ACB9KVZ4_BAUVA|nr:hypothetical protein L6164_034780 [Bauhinia variegata]